MNATVVRYSSFLKIRYSAIPRVSYSRELAKTCGGLAFIKRNANNYSIRIIIINLNTIPFDLDLDSGYDSLSLSLSFSDRQKVKNGWERIK